MCKPNIGFIYQKLSFESLTLPGDIVTWLCSISLASLGSDAVAPAGVGVLDEASQVVEELREGHVTGLVDGVVE